MRRDDQLEDSREQRFAVGSWNEAGFVQTKGQRSELARACDSGEGFACCSAFDEARQAERELRREVRGGEQGEGVVCRCSPERVEFCLGVGEAGFF